MIDITKLTDKDIGRKVRYVGPTYSQFKKLSSILTEERIWGICTVSENRIVVHNRYHFFSMRPEWLIFVEKPIKQKISRTDLFIFE